MAHHRGDARHLGVDGAADRHAALGERALVVADPVNGFLGVDERERERADPVPGREQDRLAARARHPEGRVGLLHGLWNDVARRHLHVRAVDTGERRFGHAPDGDLEALAPGIALLRGIDAEATELGRRRRLTRPELHAPTRHEVEHGEPFGGAHRVVVLRRGLDDAVAEADVARSLRCRREEHLGRAGVGVLLEEMMLDLPHAVDAEPIRELDLIERVLHQSQLGTVVPRTRQLELVEDPEPHGRIVGSGPPHPALARRTTTATPTTSTYS